MTTCYCGNHLSYEECCQPYILGLKKASTTEVLMRSRFSAYATAEVDYLVATTHKSTRKLFNKKEILNWCQNNHWTRLEVLNKNDTIVSFKAYYTDNHRQEQVHEEKSIFIFEDGNWFYVNGEY